MKNLFGEEVKAEVKDAKPKVRIAIQQWRQLHTIHGKTEGETCKNCIHLIRKQFSKTYLKCSLASNSNSPATDWRAGWVACGKFEHKKNSNR